MSRQSFIEEFFRSTSSASCSPQPAKDLPKAKMNKGKKRSNMKKAAETTPNAVELVDLSLLSDSSDTDIAIVKTEESVIELSQMSTTSADSQKTIIYGSPENFLDFKMEFTEETIVLPPPVSPIKTEKSNQGLNNISKSMEGSHTISETPSKHEGLKNSELSITSLQVSPKAPETKTPGPSTSSSKNTSISQFIELQHLQQTPLKSTVQSIKTPQSSLSKSGGSSKSQYFSPAKKRNITQKSPTVRRNLSQELEDKYLLDCVKREQLVNDEVSENNTIYTLADMDDKTIFMVTTLNDYLNNPSLSHLLDEDSFVLLRSCITAVKPGMRLVCRLYWRKEGWHKRDRAREAAGNKEPLNDNIFDEMVKDLIQKGLIEDDTSNMSLEDLASLLHKNELMHICKDLKLKVQSKQEAVDALLKFSKRTVDMKNFLIKEKDCFCTNTELVLFKMKSMGGSLYKLSDKARSVLDRLYVIMYLGLNDAVLQDKTLELILLYDKIQRETYPVDKNMTLDDASVVFKTRDQFESYITAHKVYDTFLAEKEVKEKCSIIQRVYNLYRELGDEEIMRYTAMPYWLRKYTPGGVYARILAVGITDLKKDSEDGHYLLAMNILDSLRSQDLFLQHKKADWYNEAALILDNKYHRCDEAAEILLRGFKSLSEEAAKLLRPRARKMAMQKNSKLSDNLRVELLCHANKEDMLERSIGGTHVQKQPMERSKSRGKQKFVTKTQEGRQVCEAEEFCILHYISTGDFTNGEHWEGKIITTIFFLLFWDIIYSKPSNAPGIFLSYYQKYPLDFKSDSFYKNRKENIDNMIDYIGRAKIDKLISIMRDTWNRRPEHELSGISRSIGWPNVKTVAQCLGSRGLQAACKRVAHNYRHTNGFPDLTLWNVNNQRIMFVEVKTDSDKPSMNQIAWMRYLRENNIETEFCYVGTDTMKQRSRRLADHGQKPTPSKTGNGKKRTVSQPSSSGNKKPRRSSRLDATLKKEQEHNSDDDLDAFEGS